MPLLTPALDPTPPRPSTTIAPPACRLDLVVEVEAAHLANPLLAVPRLLASEADLLARVTGDDDRLEISIALPDDAEQTKANAEAWCRWAVHIAGVRGALRVV